MITVFLTMFGCATNPDLTASGTPASTLEPTAETSRNALSFEDADEIVTEPGGARVSAGRLYYALGDGFAAPRGGALDDLVEVADVAEPFEAVPDRDADGEGDWLLYYNGLPYLYSQGEQIGGADATALPGNPVGYGVSSPEWTVVGGEGDAWVYASDDLTFTFPIAVIHTDFQDLNAAAGDIDGDGIADLVLQGSNPEGGPWFGGHVAVFSGDLAGEVVLDDAYASVSAVGTNGVGDLAGLADVDGDGYLDLGVDDSGLAVYCVHGGGDFDSQGPSIHVEDMQGARLLDFDGDGVVDVLGHDTSPTTAEPSGVFVAFGPLTIAPNRFGFTIRSDGNVLVADVDEDGADDILVDGESADELGIFYGGANRRSY